MPVCYQIWLTIATWVLPDITLIKVKTCGVWEPGVRACDTRSFFIAFAAAIGQPVLALLALNQNRFCAILGAGQFFVLIAIFYFHQPETPTSFYRDAVYCEYHDTSGELILDIVFHIFILIIDAFLERRDRQMFELREQLKKQFKETQRAQQKEKRASDLNKRFISYSMS
jgi:osomolarity two-component system sensor histidine kinase SLN1